jgi:hypothetical protein
MYKLIYLLSVKYVYKVNWVIWKIPNLKSDTMNFIYKKNFISIEPM